MDEATLKVDLMERQLEEGRAREAEMQVRRSLRSKNSSTW